MPKEMAHSHLGMASDGRYIYAVSGQYGPQCRASINRNFAFDTETREWHELPPLPLPRYVWYSALSLLAITRSWSDAYVFSMLFIFCFYHLLSSARLFKILL